jgi:hypothetical protein
MIWSSVLPAASQPRTSQTVNRRPRIQGWPQRFPGWTVMRMSTTSLTVQSYRRYPRGRAYQDWREMLPKERHDLDAV